MTYPVQGCQPLSTNNKNNKKKSLEDTHLASTQLSGYKAWTHQSMQLTPITWRVSSSSTLSRKRTLQDSVALRTAPSCHIASKVECILFARFRTTNIIWSFCSRLLHWSLCEQISTNTNYRQESGLPCVSFQKSSHQGVYCKQLSIFWQE